MDDHFAPLQRGMWVLFGNTLYLSDKPGDFLVFPGDVGTAQRLRDAHNAAMTAERRRCVQIVVDHETADAATFAATYGTTLLSAAIHPPE